MTFSSNIHKLFMKFVRSIHGSKLIRSHWLSWHFRWNLHFCSIRVSLWDGCEASTLFLLLLPHDRSSSWLLYQVCFLSFCSFVASVLIPYNFIITGNHVSLILSILYLFFDGAFLSIYEKLPHTPFYEAYSCMVKRKAESRIESSSQVQERNKGAGTITDSLESKKSPSSSLYVL